MNIFAQPQFQNFKTIFLGIVLEALPFLLLGVLVAAILQVFVSNDVIHRIVPRNPFLGVIVACLLGILFPLCECGMIPVVRKLIRKGMPLYLGMVYILSSPIINPVVFASTYMAFRSRPDIVWGRFLLAIVAAIAIGLIVYYFYRKNPLRETKLDHDNLHHHKHDHEHGTTQIGKRGKLIDMLMHAGDEFFDMGRFLLLGAFITAFIHIVIPREFLVSIGSSDLGAHVFMMAFAYLLSLCSTSDAFVAASFVSTFSSGSLLAFLVYGPMLDLKNTLMMLSIFKLRFIVFMSLIITAVVFCLTLAYSFFI